MAHGTHTKNEHVRVHKFRHSCLPVLRVNLSGEWQCCSAGAQQEPVYQCVSGRGMSIAWIHEIAEYRIQSSGPHETEEAAVVPRHAHL